MSLGVVDEVGRVSYTSGDLGGLRLRFSRSVGLSIFTVGGLLSLFGMIFLSIGVCFASIILVMAIRG